MGTQLTVAALMDELLQEIASVRIDADGRSVGVADSHHHHPALRVRHAHEHLGEPCPRTGLIARKGDPVPAEYDLLQFELGVLTSPDRSDKGVGVKHGSRLHVRSVRRMASLMLMLPFSFTGRYLLIEPPSASLRWAGPCFSLAFRCIRPTC